MLILDQNKKTIILDNINTPIVSEYFYILDLNILDYKLTPFMMLEEINSPTIEIKIYGFRLKIPSFWNILIVDPENMSLDVIPVNELSGRDFNVFAYGFDSPLVETPFVNVTNYLPNYKIISPSLHKHQVLCHPISPTKWIHLTPNDVYNKYLKNIMCGDII